jgi:hypothetical protein
MVYIMTDIGKYKCIIIFIFSYAPSIIVSLRCRRVRDIIIFYIVAIDIKSAADGRKPA